MLVRLPDGKTLEVRTSPKQSLGDALRGAGVLIDMRCGGHGVCGKCEALLLKGSFLVEGLRLEVAEPKSVLACVSFALGENAVIELPQSSLSVSEGQLLEAFQPWLELGKASRREGLAVAIDVGTTSVAAALIDLESGKILATDSAYNAQLRYGDNVIARIAFASGSEEKLKTLQRVLIDETINPLIRNVCAEAKHEAPAIGLASFSGNTVMTHLLYGLPPDSMGQMPFEPFATRYPEIPAKTLGLAIAPEARCLAAPSVSGFIGGDTVSGARVCALDSAKGAVALLDLGTNCETAIALDGKITACASAAGPAFEGAGIACGRRASPGAIDRLRIKEGLVFEFSSLGGAKPNGLCGSAMIDFIAEARRKGLLNEFGRLDMALLEKHGRAMKADGVSACRIDEAGEVYLSERDIEQLLKAKAAIAAGLKTLCAELGLTPEGLDQIILAGGFAQYMDIANAIEAGMLPKLPLERFRKAGNSSLAGAARLVLDAKGPQDFDAQAERMRTIVLNEMPAFEDNYIDALMLP